MAIQRGVLPTNARDTTILDDEVMIGIYRQQKKPMASEMFDSSNTWNDYPT